MRRAINQRVTGDPDLWPISDLHRRLVTMIGPCLSIGCGTGSLERSIIQDKISRDVIGIDVSENVSRLVSRCRLECAARI